MHSTDGNEYLNRRRHLQHQVGNGIILLPGHDESPINFAANCYPFRQDSSFLYYFGPNRPALTGWIDVEADRHRIFGPAPGPQDAVWSGPQPGLEQLAAEAGADYGGGRDELKAAFRRARATGRRLHYLPPMRAGTRLKLARLIGADPDTAAGGFSERMTAAVIGQRSCKTPAEAAEIEAAAAICTRIFDRILALCRPGVGEREIAAQVRRILAAAGSREAFQPIVTVRGQRLHNPHYDNILKPGDLLLADLGAESRLGYAADITRTFPVSGRFAGRRRAVYTIVLEAQRAGIGAVRPGVRYIEVHRAASRCIASGLFDLGLMRGDVEAAVAVGAHALFFPHGFGHMLGLDVHDMESLGEDRVGYGAGESRRRQFGLASLRLARTLETGFAVTAEPGIYFIPELVSEWRRSGRHREFIDYDRVEAFLGLGGVRIEDDLWVTPNGCKVLSAAIPKEIEEIEARLRAVQE